MSEPRCDCSESPPPVEKGCCQPAAEKDQPCCPPPQTETSSCCPPARTGEDTFRYRRWPFVAEWLETPAGKVPRIRTELVLTDRLGHWAMRWGLGRSRYRVEPGLYAVGDPGPASPVLVSANYKMSFDLLRRELEGLSAWILVIDTKGINVWCAAGKGTFGTTEILRQVRKVGLERVVSHRTLVLPQLGAPGVAAHRVKTGSGFSVVYGPVRARDVKAFLAAGMTATPQMRRVTFTTLERLVLTPVELTGMIKVSLWATLILLVLGGLGRDLFSLAAAWQRGGGAILAYLAGLLAGAVLTPVLLPWLPGRAFALKGALVGAALAVSAALGLWDRLGDGNALALLLALPAVASFCAMNFTGSTTFTSPSGVEKEMRRAIPLQATALLTAGIVWVSWAFLA